MNSIGDKQDMLDAGSDFWGGESGQQLNGQVALCRIVEVNQTKRTCTIKTYGNSAVASNGDYQNVQWLMPYSSLLGDEISFVPEPDSQALCIFEGDQPYIVGFFNPLTLDPDRVIPDAENEGVDPAGGSAAVNKEQINVGDFIFRTAGKCRIVMRRGGEIEIESTKLCKRTYFPARNLINELSQNFEMRTDGGTIDWIHPDPTSENTYFRQEWRDNVSRDNIIIDERGTIADNPGLIHRFQIGPTPETNNDTPPPFEPVLIRDTFNTGATRFIINQTLYEEEIKATGEYTKGVNGYLYYQNIKPTGEVIENINNNFQQRILPSGEMTLDIGIDTAKEENIKPTGGDGKFKLNVKPSGDTTVEINSKVKVQMLADGNVTIDSGPGKSTVTITPDGAVTIKTSTSVTCQSPLVDLKADNVKLGKSPGDVVPMGKLFLAAMNKVIDVFNGHQHPVQTKGGPAAQAGISEPPIKPAQTIGEDVLSKTVEVQP